MATGIEIILNKMKDFEVNPTLMGTIILLCYFYVLFIASSAINWVLATGGWQMNAFENSY